MQQVQQNPAKHKLDEPPPFMPGEFLLTFDRSSAVPAANDTQLVHESFVGRVREVFEGRQRGDADDDDSDDDDGKPILIDPRPLLTRVSALLGGAKLTVVDTHGRPVPEPTLQRLPQTLRVRLQGSTVTDAVLRIDENLPDLRQGALAVSSAMPNWVLSSSQINPDHTRGGGCGGPGTVPASAPDGAWRFVMPRAGAWHDHDDDGDADDPRVIVAVLDTWPDLPSDHRAQTFHDRYPHNAPLRRFMERLDHGDVHTDAFERPTDVPPSLSNASADHGLFVSGIIQRIAPHAELHVLRVLDDKGFGRTDLLLDALDYCATTLARPGRRLVVNMSLYLLIPPKDAPRDEAGRLDPRVAAKLDEAVRSGVARVLKAGGVVVAAAGNDGLIYDFEVETPPQHYQPRFPADYHGVISVVATDRWGQIANYSNCGDLPAATSIATWGGQGIVDPQQLAALGQIEPGTLLPQNELPDVIVPPLPDGSRLDGVVSLYTQKVVRSADERGTGAENKTGWAYWSGTSFATPVISGIVANLLAKNPDFTRQQVMWELYRMAEPQAITDRRLACPYIRVWQEQW